MDRQQIAFATAGVPIVLLLYGILSGRWIVGTYGLGAGQGDISLGLRGVELCFEGLRCESRSFSELGGSTLAEKLGLACTLLGLLAMVSLGGSIANRVRQFARDWPVAPTTIAIVTCSIALIVAVIELITLQSLVGSSSAGTNLGFVSYGLGCAVGLTGAILVGQIPITDEEWFEPPFDAA